MEPLRTTPRYITLADDLRSQIELGELAAGDRLPSEAELATRYGFSRGTVVKAIELLVTEGVVNRKQGSGSFVSKLSLHRKAGKLLSFVDSVKEDGHRTEQSIISLGEAKVGTAREFGVAPPAVSLKRLRSVDGVPCAIHHSIIPHSVFGGLFDSAKQQLEVLNRPDFSLYARFEKRGLLVSEARERVTARLAEAEEVELLGIVAGAPVIVVFRVSYSANGVLLDAVEAVYRSDYYTYDTHLIRGAGSTDSKLRLATTTDGFSNTQSNLTTGRKS